MDNKKITLEELIARKEQSQRDKLEYKEIEVKILGGDITVKKLPLATILRMLDDAGDKRTATEAMEFSKQLIYKSCPLLQDKKLQSAYSEQITEPFDIVTAVFDDNVGVINDITENILSFYGMSEAEKEIKN